MDMSENEWTEHVGMNKDIDWLALKDLPLSAEL